MVDDVKTQVVNNLAALIDIEEKRNVEISQICLTDDPSDAITPPQYTVFWQVQKHLSGFGIKFDKELERVRSLFERELSRLEKEIEKQSKLTEKSQDKWEEKWKRIEILFKRLNEVISIRENFSWEGTFDSDGIMKTIIDSLVSDCQIYSQQYSRHCGALSLLMDNGIWIGKVHRDISLLEQVYESMVIGKIKYIEQNCQAEKKEAKSSLNPFSYWRCNENDTKSKFSYANVVESMEDFSQLIDIVNGNEYKNSFMFGKNYSGIWQHLVKIFKSQMKGLVSDTLETRLRLSPQSTMRSDCLKKLYSIYDITFYSCASESQVDYDEIGQLDQNETKGNGENEDGHDSKHTEDLEYDVLDRITKTKQVTQADQAEQRVKMIEIETKLMKECNYTKEDLMSMQKDRCLLQQRINESEKEERKQIIDGLVSDSGALSKREKHLAIDKLSRLLKVINSCRKMSKHNILLMEPFKLDLVDEILRYYIKFYVKESIVGWNILNKE